MCVSLTSPCNCGKYQAEGIKASVYPALACPPSPSTDVDGQCWARLLFPESQITLTSMLFCICWSLG